MSTHAWTSATDVVLAAAGPDALAVGGLAASLDAPLLLTPGDRLAAGIANELDRLGAERVHVMGGTGVVAEAVTDALTSAGYEVRRVAGFSRFGTAAAAARVIGPAASGDIVLAPAPADAVGGWPEALSAGAFAATRDRPPLLLTYQGTLPHASEEAALELVGPQGLVLVVGDLEAVSQPVVDRLVLLGLTVQRIAGRDRCETSVAVASAALRRFERVPRPLIVTSGTDSSEGLVAAALAARLDGVLLLVPPRDLADGPCIAPWVAAQAGRFSELLVVGGTATVSDQVADQLVQAMEGQPAWLPAPAPVPPGTIPQQAAVLAAQVATGGDDGPAALLTAGGLAGFTVLDTAGAPIVAPDPGRDQGLALDGWEMAGLSGLAALQQDADLTAFGAELASELPELADAPLGEFLLDGVRAAAADGDAPLGFWGLFVVELGRHAPDPHDLLTDPPSAIHLTAAQVSLLLHRLVGDLSAFVDSHSPPQTPTETEVSAAAPDFRAAGLSRPCTLSETERAILDTAAVGVTNAFDKLLNYLESAGLGSAAKIGKVTGYAQIALTLAQLLITFSAMKVTQKLDHGGLALKRTQEATIPGERRTLVTTVGMDIGNLQYVNCLRFVLNLAGVDFSLPNDGAFPGAKVDTPLGNVGEPSPVRGQPGETFRNKVTDPQGQVETRIEGAPQREELPDNVRPVDRTFVSRARVQVTGANLLQDFRDAADTVLDGPVVGLVSLAAGLLTRTRWLGTFTTTHPYIDWEEGHDRWQGTITGKLTPHPDSGHTWQETWTANVTLVRRDAPGRPERGYVLQQGTISFKSSGQTPGCTWETSSGLLPLKPDEPDDWSIEFAAPDYRTWSGSGLSRGVSYPITITCEDGTTRQGKGPLGHLLFQTGEEQVTDPDTHVLQGSHSSPLFGSPLSEIGEWTWKLTR